MRPPKDSDFEDVTQIIISVKISFILLVITTSAPVTVPAKEMNGIPFPDLTCASFLTIMSSTESRVEFNGREWVLLRSVLVMDKKPDQKYYSTGVAITCPLIEK